ncbi:recombinase family protein [Curtobacterium sp. SL109]|uniref:recombinase family protein n=1 Tax=Curtobacterium sp. SL109 TaxID=2994662 RepID=UPI002273759C|nr:recombinase family protein [Curtobacterium sp. SL109]MCY1696480.1 recombinase family protein [Curtobacterium sp. SL109]
MRTHARVQAAIYTRISRDQTGEGEGVQRQEEACRKLAESMGIENPVIYSDNDIGASNRTGPKARPEYEAMLRAVQDGTVSTIIAYSNSRLTRRPKEWIKLIDLASEGKLQIATVVSGRHDLTTADGRAVALTVAAWDGAESDRISERQTITFERNALEGKPKLQRQRAFGWEADGITLREEEANLIRSAIEKIKNGASIASIQHEWNRAGIRTAVDPEQSKKKTKPTGEWEWSVVYRVLLGWRTVGVRTRHREPLRDGHGELVKGAWEPIITIEDRNQALSMLQRLSRKKIRTGSWPLAGILRCGECIQPLYGQLPSGTRSRALYACKKGHLAISAGLLEQYLISLVANRAYKDQQGRRQAYEPVTEQDFPGTEEIKRAEEMIPELMAAWRERRLAGAIAFPEVEVLNRRIKELTNQRDEFLASHSAPISPLRRSSDALEELLDMQGQFLRVTPPSPSSAGPRLGEPDEGETSNAWTPGAEHVRSRDRVQELPFAATDEETAELNTLLRGEFKWVAIRKGKAGRQSAEQFASRVDPLWR